MDRLLQDVRFAFRTLRKSWGVTTLVIGSLALAIAGNTIVFSLLNGLLYRPLPYEEPRRIMLLAERTLDAPEGFVNPVSTASFLDWQEQQTSFQTMAGMRGQPLGLERGEGDEKVEAVTGAAVSPGFFSVLGTKLARGREFLPEEATIGRHRSVILTHERWQKEEGGRADVLGQTLKLNGEVYEIVGVLPEGFEFLNPSLEMFVPLAVRRETLKRHDRDLLAVARLKDGVSEEAAQAEMTAIAARLADAYPESNRGYVVDVLNLREEIPDARNRLFFKMLQGALIFVMLIACANIANLLMARGRRREREMAVRTSIGASRGQIVRQLITESLAMAGIAGVLGTALGAVGVRQVAAAFGEQLPKMYAPSIDGRVLLFTLGVTLFGGLLFGLAPVLQTLRLDLLSSLKDGSAAATAGGRKRFVSKALVVAELTLALVFLAGAGILLRSFDLLQHQQSGIDTKNLLTMQVGLPPTRYATDAEKAGAVEAMTTRLAALPGVERATAASNLPKTFILQRDNFVVDAAPPPTGQPLPQVAWLAGDAAFFPTVGIRTTAGRAIETTDRSDSPKVAVVNQALVEKHFAGKDPIGQRITLLGESREIVGVVENARHLLAFVQAFDAVAYLPWSQVPQSGVVVNLRTAVEPSTLIADVRKAIYEVDPGFAVSQIQPLDELIDKFWTGQRVVGAILRAFGGLALLLAAIGTYGVLAYSVALRTQEIGIRIALGADRASVVRMVMRQGLVLGAIGFAIGAPLVFFVKKGIDAVMAGFVPVEMAGMGGAVAVMVFVVLLASFLPARRAASVDPIKALRWE